MGLSIDKEEFEEQDFADFADRLQQSLTILRDLLSRPGFGEGTLTLGAELELPIIDKAGLAFPINRSLLAQSADSSLQLELDRFNIEFNATPVALIGSPFTALHTQLTNAIQHINICFIIRLRILCDYADGAANHISSKVHRVRPFDNFHTFDI